MDKTGYDIDGVISVGVYPSKDSLIITGRSYEEAQETMLYLAQKGVSNQVMFNPLPYNQKTRETSGRWKAKCIKEFGITRFFEDDEIQIKEILKENPNVQIVWCNHNLSEKENMKHTFEEEILMRPKGTNLYNGFVDLCEKLKRNNVQKIIEIGSFKGESIAIMKEIMPNAIIISIDPYHTQDDVNDGLQNRDLSSVEKEFQKSISSLTGIIKVPFKSEDIHWLFQDESVDAIYIDGLHTKEQVELDIKLYQEKVKKGGFICGHDWDINDEMITTSSPDWFNNDGSKQIRKNVTEVVNKFCFNEKKIVFEDSSWLIKKV